MAKSQIQNKPLKIKYKNLKKSQDCINNNTNNNNNNSNPSSNSSNTNKKSLGKLIDLNL